MKKVFKLKGFFVFERTKISYFLINISILMLIDSGSNTKYIFRNLINIAYFNGYYKT